MALLNRLLQFLQFVERLSDGLLYLSTPVGLAGLACLAGYAALLQAGCDAPSASVLSLTFALALHSALPSPP